jgi:hypothetical protein
MSIAPKPAQSGPQETDLLVKFEIDNIPAEYREYYATKRNNFFASIQGFDGLWDYYTKLDQVLMREFADLNSATDANTMFPLVLYFKAHAKMRVSIELGLSGCLSESRSILRDAIEFVAHAHSMLADPQLQMIWLSKNDGKAALDAFAEAFERHKKTGVFNGLAELHKTWGELSEIGSHANLNALADSFVHLTSDDHIEYRINYTGADTQTWVMSLFTMLLTCSTMEEVLFMDYSSRLNLDDQLMRMRNELEKYKEWLRGTLKGRFNLDPPGGIHRPRTVIFRP